MDNYVEVPACIATSEQRIEQVWPRRSDGSCHWEADAPRRYDERASDTFHIYVAKDCYLKIDERGNQTLFCKVAA